MISVIPNYYTKSILNKCLELLYKLKSYNLRLQTNIIFNTLKNGFVII